MANNAISAGVRPKSARITVYNADSSAGSILWIKEQAVIKRLRRKLAERGHKLIITRIGTAAWCERSEYAVLKRDGNMPQDHVDLMNMARYLGVLATNEYIEQPAKKWWKFYVASKEHMVIDGIEYDRATPLTRSYESHAAAIHAAKGIKVRERLLIYRFDAEISGSKNGGDADGSL
jgi:hypothetical protein